MPRTDADAGLAPGASTQSTTTNAADSSPAEFESLASADFFTDTALVSDPYRYFDALRSRCPVHPVAHPGVVAVTGYDEAVEVYQTARRTRRAIPSVVRIRPLEIQPEVTDVTDVIEARRDQWPMSEFMVTMDGDDHETQRGLLRRLLTPASTQGERGGAGRHRRPLHRHVHRQRPLRSRRRLRQAVHHAGDRRPARGARGGPRRIPQRPRRQQHRDRRRGIDTGGQSAGVHVRQVRRVRRRPPP